MQSIIDALNRLRNAQANADKYKHAQFATGAITGALAGGVQFTITPPNHAWDYVDGLSLSALSDWADDMEASAESVEESEGG